MLLARKKLNVRVEATERKQPGRDKDASTWMVYPSGRS